MAKIYGETGPGAEELIAHVDENGRLYVYVDDDGEECVGYVDYNSEEVYDLDDDLLGWIEEDGVVILNDEDADDDDVDLAIGAVAKDGRLFIYVSEEGDQAEVGRIAEMKHPVEGAAALLFFIEDTDE